MQRIAQTVLDDKSFGVNSWAVLSQLVASFSVFGKREDARQKARRFELQFFCGEEVANFWFFGDPEVYVMILSGFGMCLK